MLPIRILPLLFLVPCLLLQSCATIMTGTTQRIRVVSNPPGANIEVNGRFVGNTPQTLTLSRSLSEKTIKVQMPGYGWRAIRLTRSIVPEVFLNILVGGIPGLVIDIATGALSRYNQDYINVDLDHIPGYSMAAPPGQ